MPKNSNTTGTAASSQRKQPRGGSSARGQATPSSSSSAPAGGKGKQTAASAAAATGSSKPPTTEVMRDASWAVAEELLSAGFATEAALVLDALLTRLAASPVAVDPRDELATRVRAADLLLANTSSTLAPSRLLEGGVRHAEAVNIPWELQFAFKRLYGVALRRRQKYTDALAALEGARAIADRRGSAKDVEAVQLELARVHFAVCLESSFASVDALTTLRDATRAAADAVRTAGAAPSDAALSMIVCHAIASSLLGDADAARELLAATLPLCGATVRTPLALLERVIAIAAGTPARDVKCSLPSDDDIARLPESVTATSSSPSASFGAGRASKQHRPEASQAAKAESRVVKDEPTDADDGSATTTTTTMWMSRGAAAALVHLTQLLEALNSGNSASVTSSSSSASSHKKSSSGGGSGATASAAVWRELSRSVDGSLKVINAASAAGGMTHAANAELRLFAGIKLAAFFELALADLTRADYAEAGSKLDSLSSYMLVFVRHTAHFAPLFHAAVGCLALAINNVEAADQHLAVLVGASGTDARQQTGFLSGNAEALAVAFVLSGYRAVVTNDPETLETVVEVAAGLADAPSPARDDGPRLSTASGHHRHSTAGSVGSGGGSATPLPPAARDALQRSPRLQLVLNLLRGIHELRRQDWRTGTSVLKQVSSQARDAFGITSPVVAASLRLLADVHGQSGNPGCESAGTMAVQVASACGDIVGLAQCLAWTIARLPVATDSDAARRTELVGQHQRHVAAYTAAVKAASESPAVNRVLDFLPSSNEEYRRWADRVSSGGGGAGGGGMGGRRLSTGSMR